MLKFQYHVKDERFKGFVDTRISVEIEELGSKYGFKRGDIIVGGSPNNTCIMIKTYMPSSELTSIADKLYKEGYLDYCEVFTIM